MDHGKGLFGPFSLLTPSSIHSSLPAPLNSLILPSFPPLQQPLQKNSFLDTVSLIWASQPHLWTHSPPPPSKALATNPHLSPPHTTSHTTCSSPPVFFVAHRTHGLTRVEYHNPSQTTRSTPPWLHSASILVMPLPGQRSPTPRFRTFLASDQLLCERACPSPSFRLQHHDLATAIRLTHLL